MLALLWPGRSVAAASCVWKVTSGGHTLYLAGSVHALRPEDYPLPPAYDQAFNASSALALEVSPDISEKTWSAALARAGTLPPGVTLKDRVDPRTYAYIRRVLAHIHGSTNPEKKIEHSKPWAISWMLQSPGGGFTGVTQKRGVEEYLEAKARAAHKPMTGLVPFDEHIAVFGAMSDADSEALLLLEFIHLDKEGAEFSHLLNAWKKGDIATITGIMEAEYHDTPSIRQRIITNRNLRWVPEIEGFLQSPKTWMVVAGSYHMAGEQGLPALLRSRGYAVEQL